MVKLLKELIKGHSDRLSLSKDFVCEELEVSKLEVPWQNFITQGVSSRRDADYVTSQFIRFMNLLLLRMGSPFLMPARLPRDHFCHPKSLLRIGFGHAPLSGLTILRRVFSKITTRKLGQFFVILSLFTYAAK